MIILIMLIRYLEYGQRHALVKALTRQLDIRHLRLLAAGVVGYTFLLRCLYCAKVELLPEEAYYWNYSQHLAIGYLDHPPLVAWLIRGGTGLFGHCEFGVRFGALCCGAVTAFYVFKLAKNLFGEICGLYALILVQGLPFFFLSGLLVTPDAPLTAAWAASLFFLERALIGGKPRAWLALGLAMGVGMLAKYTMALLGVAILIFMCCDSLSRPWFRRYAPYAALLLAAVIFTPVNIWNFEHDWASFAFQSTRRLAEPYRFSLHKLLASGLVLLTPLGLWAAAAAALPRRAVTRGERMLQFAIWVPLAVFAAFSMRHDVKLDWTGAPWMAALPLMAVGFANLPGGRVRAAVGSAAAWVSTLLMAEVLYSVGLFYLAVGIPGVGYSAHMELLPVGWRGFGEQIEQLRNTLRETSHRDVLVVGMDRYAIASEASFYAHDPAP
ncbi:MAG: glycosyltransferase family 39 protein, partial [Pseudomonadota bacterium]|nr:glycosyltransferase family 39 protein [Pseudomonadota bacterium]